MYTLVLWKEKCLDRNGMNRITHIS